MDLITMQSCMRIVSSAFGIKKRKNRITIGQKQMEVFMQMNGIFIMNGISITMEKKEEHVVVFR